MKKVFRVEVDREGNEIGVDRIGRCLRSNHFALSSACVVTVTEIDEMKVGDPVRTDAGNEGTVAASETGYRITGPGMTFCGLYTRDQLTKIPPEPPKPTYRVEYRVEYRDDWLFVWDSDDELASKISMEDPAAVANWIICWGSACGIDADEVRQMIAVPRKLESRTVDFLSVVANRHADGWEATIPTSIAFDGERIPLDFRFPEDAARKIFPTVNGPYRKQP